MNKLLISSLKISGLKRPLFLLSTSGIPVSILTCAVVLFTDLESTKWGLILASLFISSLSLTFGIITANRIREPLVTLTDAVEQLADGNLNALIEYQGSDEIERLIRAFESTRNTLASSYTAIQEYINGLQVRVRELTALKGIDSAILSGESLESILDLATERICEFAEGDSCLIILLNKKDNSMQVRSVFGFDREEKRLLYGKLRGDIDCNPCFSLEPGEVMAIENLNELHLSDDAKEAFKNFGAESMLTAPLLSGNQAIGSIVVLYKKARELDERVVSSFKQLVSQTSIAIKSANLVDEMKSLSINSMRALVKAIDARDPYTANHSDRVSRFSVALAQELGLNQDEVRIVEYAGLLHDIGKIGIDERILNKPSHLTTEEMTVMKNHANMSAEIIEPIEFLSDAVPIVRHHHEWFNGQGYPSGLAGDEIPLGARILAVADALEAITSSRPYSSKLTLLDGIERLEKGSGTQFDPKMVRAMTKIIRRIESVDFYESDEVVNNNSCRIGSNQPEFKDAV